MRASACVVFLVRHGAGGGGGPQQEEWPVVTKSRERERGRVTRSTQISPRAAVAEPSASSVSGRDRGLLARREPRVASRPRGSTVRLVQAAATRVVARSEAESPDRPSRPCQLRGSAAAWPWQTGARRAEAECSAEAGQAAGSGGPHSTPLSPRRRGKRGAHERHARAAGASSLRRPAMEPCPYESETPSPRTRLYGT